MIACDFVYASPDTLEEAFGFFHHHGGSQPFYYAGGTEILSMAREGSLTPSCVIDIKQIPQCRVFREEDGHLVIGSAVTLSEITRAGTLPLLCTTVARIADHSIQCRLTLGGNLCGTILYREAALPLLILDCIALCYGKEGLYEAPLEKIFQERLQIPRGDILVQLKIPLAAVALPYVHVKKTRMEKIDYPLLTVVAVKGNKKTRVALTGLCGGPFRSPALDKLLKTPGLDLPALEKALPACLPAPVLSDLNGGGDYRLHVLAATLLDARKALEG